VAYSKVGALALGKLALVIANLISDNDCEGRHVTPPKNAMKAITYREYGGAEVLHLEEGAKPTPKDYQVLVQVRATALNPYDMHCLHGTPYVMRLIFGLSKPKFTGIGVDF